MMQIRIRGTYCERTVTPKSKFDPRSFRWKLSGRSWVLVGCPKEAWAPRKRRCTVGLKAHKLLAEAPKTRCRRGRKIRKG